MNPWQRDVQKFQKMIGRPPEKFPPDEETRALRSRLLIEECQETVDALKANDTIEVLDGLCDVIYIALGTAEAYGVDLEPVFAEVQRSNMTKFPNGVCTINEYGKVKKPDDWQPPDLALVLARDPIALAVENELRAFQSFCDAREDRRRLEEELLRKTVRPSI